MVIKLKRIYEQHKISDGYRIYIDRLYPRGLTKSKAAINLWMKNIAPSKELRQWYNHDTTKWISFKRKYITELKHNELIHDLKKLIKQHKTVTLLYSSKEPKNNAQVLYEYIKQ